MRLDSFRPIFSILRSFRSVFPAATLVAFLLTGCGGSSTSAGGSFTLTLSSGTLIITQGASGVVTVTIVRDGDFAGAITITVEGLPTGVTADALTIAAGGTSGQLTLAGALAAALGNTDLTVRGSGSGVADRTATLELTVIAQGGGGGNVTIPFCPATGLPLWVAYQDGNAAWAQAVGGPTSYNFQVNSNTMGVAWVTNDAAQGFNLFILFATRTEVAAINELRCAGLTGAGKMVTGTVQGIPPAAFATSVSLGGATAALAALNPPVLGTMNATFNGVRDGTVDLLGGISQIVGPLAIVPSRMFIRRELDPAAGSAINDIDFAGPNSFAPQASTLTVNGVGAGEQVLQTTQLNTAGGFVLAGQVLGPTASTNWYGAPAANLMAGDVHLLTVLATEAAVPFAPQRQVMRVAGAPAHVTLDLGPLLTPPNVVGIPATEYSRARAEYTIQAEYDRHWLASFIQGQAGQARQAQIQVTREFRGSGAGTVTLEVPDFADVAGWMPDWGLRPGAQAIWTVSGSGWTSAGGIVQPVLADGNFARTGSRLGGFTP